MLMVGLDVCLTLFTKACMLTKPSQDQCSYGCSLAVADLVGDILKAKGMA